MQATGNLASCGLVIDINGIVQQTRRLIGDLAHLFNADVGLTSTALNPHAAC